MSVLVTRARALALVLSLAVVAAVVITVVLVRDTPPEAGDDPPRDEVSAAATDPGHSPDDGHHHVDDVDPDIDPDDYAEFCAAFLALTDAYSQRAAARTPETVDGVEAAADTLLAVGEGTDLTDEVRAGFEAFVADILEQPVEVTADEQGEFSTFVNSACPA